MRRKVIIIGGGIAGLVAGYDLGKAGLDVEIVEKDRDIGGLAGSTRLTDGVEIEKFYHFICKPDVAYFRKSKELGIYDRLRWTVTRMGLYYKGKLHALGDPLSLLVFPHFSPADKMRFALSTMRSKRTSFAEAIRTLSERPSKEWLIEQYGSNVYEILYKPLMDLKFGEYKDLVSAAWMWARFKRVGSSRNRLQQEHIAYLEGGSEVYVRALGSQIERMGGIIRTGVNVEQVVFGENRIKGVRVNGDVLRADYVVSTVPVPILNRLTAEAPESYLQTEYFKNLRTLKYIHTRVMMLRINRRFSRYFWMNISDPEIELAGLIEFCNLNPMPALKGDSILYMPQYLTERNRFYSMPDDEMYELYIKYLKKLNPYFDRSWVKEWQLHRANYSQPICEMGFERQMPAIQTPLPNFFLTDSTQLHPDDRAISNSTELGEKAALGIIQNESGKTGS